MAKARHTTLVKIGPLLIAAVVFAALFFANETLGRPIAVGAAIALLVYVVGVLAVTRGKIH